MNLLFSRCPFCLETKEKMQAPICEQCNTILPWIKESCQHCGLSLPAKTAYCAHCLKKRFDFDRLIAPFNYEYPLQSMLHAFKYHQQLAIAHTLSQLLARSLEKHYLDNARPSLIIPLPLHPKKQRQRGYNQAIEMGRVLSQHFKIPMKKGLLIKRKYTESQSQLLLKKRRNNVRDAFLSDKIDAKHIALVDDIASSCFTAHEASKALKQAGAEQVDVWCLARATFH